MHNTIYLLLFVKFNILSFFFLHITRGNVIKCKVTEKKGRRKEVKHLWFIVKALKRRY